MSELTDRIMSEAAIADRTGSMLRLQTIAADVTTLQARLATALRNCRAEYNRGYREANHDCPSCADCLHDGNKCCGCYDEACCLHVAIPAAEAGDGRGI